MALVDLCYRCPECGHDPMSGEGDSACCESCGLRIERQRGRLLVSFPDNDILFDITASDLYRKIYEHGGPMTRARRAGGNIRYSARAEICWRISEQPVWHRGALLGFAESMGPKAPGTVTVDSETVAIDDGRAGSGRWHLLEIRAVQAASKSLQLSLPGDGLVQLSFPNDSPRRWEILMRRLVADAHERAGRGRVVEFQPRIVTA